MATIDDRLFRTKYTYRHYRKLLDKLAAWEDWTRAEFPDAARAASLDVTIHWLETVGHPEMAKLLEQERDALIERVIGPLQIRLRKPKRQAKPKKDQPEDKSPPEFAARTPWADARLAATG